MYLYYPHAPILLRVVKHTQRANRVLSPDGGYRWEGSGRQGHLTNTEAEALIRDGRLLVLSDEGAADIKERLPDIAAAIMRANQNSVSQKRPARLASPQKRRTRRI